MPNDPLLIPTWLQVAVTAVVAIVTGVIGAASTALLVAVGITKKFAAMERAFSTNIHELEKTFGDNIHELRRHIDSSDSKRFHDVMNIIHSEVQKSENADGVLSSRIGACEQEIAVMKDFKERRERQDEHDRNITRNS